MMRITDGLRLAIATLRRRAGLYLGAVLLPLLLLSGGCASQPAAPPAAETPVELRISAALGLKDALLDIQKQYEAKNPRIHIVYNLAAAGALQSQIEQGAPCDLFISAAQKQLNELQAKNMLRQDTRKNLVSNKLVLIVKKDANPGITSFRDLSSAKIVHLGMGEPATVPAGEYGRQTLEKLGIWNEVKPKAVLAKDVQTVVAYVETGNAEAGIVFSTVAAASDKVTVVASAPEGSHEPIVFPAAVTAASAHPRETGGFLAFLSGPEAMKIFAHYGFLPVQ